MTFYEVFVELSAKKGLLPAQAANAIGIAQSLPTKWKNNPDSVPRQDKLKQIASYFGISVADMLSRVDGCDVDAIESDLTKAMRIADALSESDLWELQLAVNQRLHQIRQDKK